MSHSRTPPLPTPAELADDDGLRSQFIRQLLRREVMALPSPPHIPAVPRVLVQFWDDAETVPDDVHACMDSWVPLEAAGFTRMLFDDDSARRFIDEHFDSRHLTALDACLHPAMRADYFRLCFILRFGGVYVDADDEYQGVDLEPLLGDGRLRMQALCYDVPSDSMVEVGPAVRDDKDGDRIFYVNNNPLIAGPEHPVIAAALARATEVLCEHIGATRDIQSLTGPGNLTAALVRHAAQQDALDKAYDFEVMTVWDEVAISKWPLAYREDGRNWRNWVRGAAVPQAGKPTGS